MPSEHKKNGKGSARRPTLISKDDETKRWLLSMSDAKNLPPSCDYCTARTLKAICGICCGYNQYSPISKNDVRTFPEE